MRKYVLFLRGINVGGNKKVPMAQLRKVLEKEGFMNVQTLLNSGNVICEIAASANNVKEKVEILMEKVFGFHSDVIVRTDKEIEKIISLDPFKSIKVSKDTRLYISFLAENAKSGLKIPHTTTGGELKILKVTDKEVFGVLDVSKGKTTEAMQILEKEFASPRKRPGEAGKNITTRNWNTIVKIASKL